MLEAQPERPQAANIVTSDNLAQWTAEKLNLAPSAETPATESAQPVAESVEAAESESAPEGTEQNTEGKKPNPKLEKRFSEITKQREAAREEARQERVAREALEAKLKELESKVTPPAAPVAENVEPRPEQFTDMYEYAKALAEYTAERKIQEMKQREVEAQLAAQRESVVKSWAERVNQVKQELPDFEAMVASSDVVVSNDIRDAIIESDVGPKILYYLAENPDVANKLQGMTTRAALKELGKLEARFEKTSEKPAPTVKASKAPAPINPLRGTAAGSDVPMDSSGNFTGSYQAWKAARMAGRIR